VGVVVWVGVDVGVGVKLWVDVGWLVFAGNGDGVVAATGCSTGAGVGVAVNILPTALMPSRSPMDINPLIKAAASGPIGGDFLA